MKIKKYHRYNKIGKIGRNSVFYSKKKSFLLSQINSGLRDVGGGIVALKFLKKFIEIAGISVWVVIHFFVHMFKILWKKLCYNIQ